MECPFSSSGCDDDYGGHPPLSLAVGGEGSLDPLSECGFSKHWSCLAVTMAPWLQVYIVTVWGLQQGRLMQEQVGPINSLRHYL